jgi:predicted permease
MKTAFLSTLNPMLTLFICIALGFLSKKAKLLPDNAGTVMAKLETWIFCPALSFSAMATYCTPDKIGAHAINLLISCLGLAIALGIASPLSRVFARGSRAERGIYLYALTFANFGYMGDPVVRAIFGDEIFAYYKLFCLPLYMLIYLFGIGLLVPDGEGGAHGVIKKLLNPSTVAMLIGVAVGLSGIGGFIPAPVNSALDLLKDCMGPVAMLLTGFIIAKYDAKKMLKCKRTYLATALRLIVIPSVILCSLFGLKELLSLAIGAPISNGVIFLAFFATATPLGLNTVVFPEAYGGNPEIGAGMAMISHAVGILTIPILYSLLTLILGEPVF